MKRYETRNSCLRSELRFLNTRLISSQLPICPRFQRHSQFPREINDLRGLPPRELARRGLAERERERDCLPLDERFLPAKILHATRRKTWFRSAPLISKKRARKPRSFSLLSKCGVVCIAEERNEGRKVFQLVIISKTGSCLGYPRLEKREKKKKKNSYSSHPSRHIAATMASPPLDSVVLSRVFNRS